MSTEVFYRVHWNWGVVPFDAEHAYSYGGGQPPLASDITRWECIACDGTGEIPGEGTCTSCDGEGSREADRGYSCCTSPEDLMASAEQMGWGSAGIASARGRVVIFEGEQAGTGWDGEPLVIPSQIVRTLTWDEFTAENGQ